MLNLIKSLGKIKNDPVKNCLMITRFFVWFRESFLPTVSSLFQRDRSEEVFQAYTKVGFVEDFGGTQQTVTSHSAYQGPFSGRKRILVKQEVMAELWEKLHPSHD